MAGRRRVGVLISGRGSNMATLVAAAADPAYPAEIAVVIANRPDAAGLETAARAGIPAVAVDHKAYPDKPGFETAMTAVLDAHGVEIVALAGFMRLLSSTFIDRWRDRLINIHPSLLPAYRGLDTHARAIADGALVAGCSVHFVRPEVDTGPVIAQAVVPILPGDDTDSLSRRVLAAEHRLYPHALALVASGAVRAGAERAVYEGVDFDPQACLMTPISP
ncbi:MAG TPA: phosphoribosylglycinamide formyltransferase [Methylomirabilota bacterium]|nr:phosphoribosylglycinamide formyltransferase [Methylomirabilota bacterium]